MANKRSLLSILALGALSINSSCSQRDYTLSNGIVIPGSNILRIGERNGNIKIYTKDGRFVNQFGSELLEFPKDIAYDRVHSENILYIADSEIDKIFKFRCILPAETTISPTNSQPVLHVQEPISINTNLTVPQNSCSDSDGLSPSIYGSVTSTSTDNRRVTLGVGESISFIRNGVSYNLVLSSVNELSINDNQFEIEIGVRYRRGDIWVTVVNMVDAPGTANDRVTLLVNDVQSAETYSDSCISSSNFLWEYSCNPGGLWKQNCYKCDSCLNGKCINAYKRHTVQECESAERRG